MPRAPNSPSSPSGNEKHLSALRQELQERRAKGGWESLLTLSLFLLTVFCLFERSSAHSLNIIVSHQKNRLAEEKQADGCVHLRDFVEKRKVVTSVDSKQLMVLQMMQRRDDYLQKMFDLRQQVQHLRVSKTWPVDR